MHIFLTLEKNGGMLFLSFTFALTVLAQATPARLKEVLMTGYISVTFASLEKNTCLYVVVLKLYYSSSK